MFTPDRSMLCCSSEDFHCGFKHSFVFLSFVITLTHGCQSKAYVDGSQIPSGGTMQDDCPKFRFISKSNHQLLSLPGEIPLSRFFYHQRCKHTTSMVVMHSIGSGIRTPNRTNDLRLRITDIPSPLQLFH